MAAIVNMDMMTTQDTSDSKAELSTVFGWIFEYCCYIFWEEFQENFTVDSTSDRHILEGLSGLFKMVNLLVTNLDSY